MRILDRFGTQQIIGVGPSIDELVEVAAIASGDYILLHDENQKVLGKFSATSLGVNWGNVIVVAKSGGDYTTIASAISASTSGDVILVLPGTYAEGDLVLPIQVSLVGLARISTLIESTGATHGLQVNANSYVESLSFGFIGPGKVIEIVGGSSVLDNIEITGVAIDAADVYGIYNGSSTTIKYSDVLTSNIGAGDAYGLYNSIGAIATSYVSGGSIFADNSAIHVISGHTTYLYEVPRLTGGITGTGAVYGIYSDAGGDVLLGSGNSLTGIIDLNGVADALILDADGDTTVYSDSDDDPKVKVAGVVHNLGVVADSITRTVGSGKDHATIQAAVDWFKNKIIAGSCKIDVDAGSYDEQVLIEDLLIVGDGSLEIEGDTRILAGISYVDGAACNQASLANGGSGAVTLSNAGAVITVAGAGGNPDFDADGWGSGDKVLVRDNAASITEYTVDSVLNNTITLTVAAPAIGNDGTAICLLPDRRIERTLAGECVVVNQSRGVRLDGFYLETATGAACHGLYAYNSAFVNAENLATLVEEFGIYMQHGAMLKAGGGAISTWGGTYGVAINLNCYAYLRYLHVVDPSSHGVYLLGFSLADVQSSVAVHCNRGYASLRHSYIDATSATARQNTTGYYAYLNGTLEGSSTNANNNGNGADYSPAPGAIPGSAEGNSYGVLYAS